MACIGFQQTLFTGSALPLRSRLSLLQPPARAFPKLGHMSRHATRSPSCFQQAVFLHVSTAARRRGARRTFGVGDDILQRFQHWNLADEKNRVPHGHNTQRRREFSSDSTVKQPSFREFMRLVTHPVTVITSTDVNVDKHGGPRSWRGATVSSFNSVTLNPEPYVSFNMKKLSSTYDAIQNSNMFAVHVLSETSSAVGMATHFSRGNNANPFFTEHAQDSGESTLQPFISKEADGKAWSGSAKGLVKTKLPPVLQWEQGERQGAVIFAILCEYQPEKTQEVGDHVVVIGKVLHVHTTGTLHDALEENLSKAPAPRTSLTYANGRYCNEGFG